MNVLNHDKVPFRDMTPEERSAIVEALMLGNCEYWSGECWCKHGTDAIFSYCIYRTKTRQLIIPWEVIKPEYKWAAMTEHMDVILSSVCPLVTNGGYWWWESGITALVEELNINTDGIDWRESLVQRPEGV